MADKVLTAAEAESQYRPTIGNRVLDSDPGGGFLALERLLRKSKAEYAQELLGLMGNKVWGVKSINDRQVRVYFRDSVDSSYQILLNPTGTSIMIVRPEGGAREVAAQINEWIKGLFMPDPKTYTPSRAIGGTKG